MAQAAWAAGPPQRQGEGWVLPMFDSLKQTHGQAARATTDIQTPPTIGRSLALQHNHRAPREKQSTVSPAQGLFWHGTASEIFRIFAK